VPLDFMKDYMDVNADNEEDFWYFASQIILIFIEKY
jgi:hypothetical protein